MDLVPRTTKELSHFRSQKILNQGSLLQEQERRLQEQERRLQEHGLSSKVECPPENIWTERMETYHHGNNISESGELISKDYSFCGDRTPEAIAYAKVRTIQQGASGFTIVQIENHKIQNTNRYERRLKVWYHSEIEDSKIGYEGKRVNRCRANKHIGKSLYTIS